MKFWDSSAVIPLLVEEPTTATILEVRERDPMMLVWWATEIECVSALARLERGGALSADGTGAALARLDALMPSCAQVQPTDTLRVAARRMLRVHDLRAADAQQLAAATVAAEGHPASLEVVSLDQRLLAAARREGFAIVDVA
jgi:predicted nucleic acid-binding protein